MEDIADLSCPLPHAASTGERHRVLRWLIPDLALTVSAITLFFCLFLFDGTRRLFRDSDTGWHIRTGEAMLAGAGLPVSDPYSFTRQGQPWFAWEWGSDLMMGVAHRAGGLAFVSGLYALAIAVCTWLWFRLHWAVRGNFLLAGAFATLLLSTGNIHWLARPHVFSWLLLLGFVLYFECGGRRLAVVALLAAVWANLHASFFLAPVIAAIYALSAFLKPFIWKSERGDALWFAQAAGVAALASLINPYGWQLHRHVLEYLLNSELLNRIGEFQTFNFHSEGATQILLALGIGAAGGILALTQQNLAHFLLMLTFTAMGLRSARALPLVALLLLPLANGAITSGLRGARNLQPELRRGLDAFLRYTDNLRRIDAGQNGFVWLPVAIASLFSVLSIPAVSARAGFPPDQFPAAAAERVASLSKDARILAPDMYGGYLIYRFNGSRKVFFDGRSDFYGLDFMKDYLKLIEVRSGWQQQVEALRFTHALLPVRYSLVPALEQLGWTRLYTDEVATLLEKH